LAAAVVAGARERLRAAGRLDLSGPTGTARLLLPLLLAEQPLLLVVPSDREVETATDDLRSLAAEAGLAGDVLPFPSPGPLPYRGLPRHPDAGLKRATALHSAHRERLRAVVASPAGLLRPTLQRDLFETRVFTLAEGEELIPEMLLEALDEGGYRREDPVTAAGQMARRGGVLDLYPPERDTPVRVEFFGDTIDSLRAFDPDTQRTVRALQQVEVTPLSDVFAPRSVLMRLRERLPARFGDAAARPLLEKLERGLLAGDEAADLLGLVPEALVPAWEHLAAFTLAVLDPEAVAQAARDLHGRAREERERRTDALALEPGELLLPEEVLFERLDRPPIVRVRDVDTEQIGMHVATRPVRKYGGDLRALVADLRQAPSHTVILLGSPGRAGRLRDVLREDGIEEGANLEIDVAALSSGFELPEVPLRVLADGDVFPEEVHLHPRGRRRGARSFLSDFRDLKVGDLVVHEDHGIGRFMGLETLEIGGLAREFMVLGYQGGDKLKVPIEAFDRVQKYASAEGARPLIDRLGSGNWDKVKKRVKKAMRDMAAELLKLYAERKARPGHAFHGESPWQHEFEEAFAYEETPDQAAAIVDVAADMAGDSPMDRLVCGDVGYGKTEVAMRAAMRAVLDEKQVAVLAPTTVLAFQHWKTFRTRFAPFPVRVEMISRFRSPKEIKQVLTATAAGAVDILIGTHRLLSKDVVFRDLGLLVIDEEQRFGVEAKEKLKRLRTTVDALTLSATPIPRTLQMGLAGIRDMSVIETPPRDRLAIQTSIVKFSTDVIASAVRQELARDGQVYVVHNRVESIYSLAGLVQKLVPEARVVVGHGQMPEAELEKSMLAFVEGRADVLVATTIIENGLDIPRANTLVVNRADRFGLAQLYQLRGRVGRADRQAFAYLLVPPDTVLSEIARKRLAAIREFSELGAGFRIAALDLELRGAGNLLGGQQSGHIEAVGLDLYLKLLEQAVLELKAAPGAPPAAERPRATLNLKVDLRIPESYVPEVHQRMALYKRVSEAADAAAVERLREEVRDRYGAPTGEVLRLFEFASLRLRAEALGLTQVDLAGGALHLRFGESGGLPPEALVARVQAVPGASLSPQGVLRVPFPAGDDALEALPELLGLLEEDARRGASAAL
ncbi:MAG TPA: transcription-repair coupling factor, partial [Vicinamibacteria bacterium]|nr:transcription-repair coupling factor [Vicinamibacteria bacterium]